MISSHPSIGIGILNYNGKKFLEVLIPQLYQLSYPVYTIYVIDNTSSDDSIAYLQQQHPDVKVIALNDNYGFAGGYNRGFAQMEEDYYLMMNSDVEVPANFLEPLVELMESDNTIASCQPKLLALLEKDKFEHGGAAGGMIDFLGYPFCRGRLFETVEHDEGQYDNVQPIFWSAGACALIRRETYRKVNGMYEYYFMHSEEIDLCRRFISAGYKIVYCPTSYIYHLGGGSLSYQSPRKTFLNFRNNIIMCFRNSPWYINVWLLPCRFCLDVLAAITFLLKSDLPNTKAVFKAYYGFFRWIITEKNKFPEKKKSLLSISTVLKKSIVWSYYVGKVDHYSQLK